MKKRVCSNRRSFLIKSTVLAGGLVLSLTGTKNMQSRTIDEDDVTLKIDDTSPLSKVGGAQFFEYKGDKIVVIRKSETEFAAYSAICTHQGGYLRYDESTQQFLCPVHDSKFDADGRKLSGPGKQPLAAFPTQTAVVVSLRL